MAWLTPNDFGTNKGWDVAMGGDAFRFRGPERRPVIRASPGRLLHRLGFIAQTLVVFPTLLKSARKQLFYCHRGIFLL